MFDDVVASHVPTKVVRGDAEAVVLVSLSDWNARDSMINLDSDPMNAAGLAPPIQELDAGDDPT